MKTSTALLLSAIIVAAALVLTPSTGRYQLVKTITGGGQVFEALILDSRTGKTTPCTFDDDADTLRCPVPKH